MRIFTLPRRREGKQPDNVIVLEQWLSAHRRPDPRDPAGACIPPRDQLLAEISLDALLRAVAQ